MKYLMVAVLVLISAPAFADGFVCQTRNGDLNVKLYNKIGRASCRERV